MPIKHWKRSLEGFYYLNSRQPSLSLGTWSEDSFKDEHNDDLKDISGVILPAESSAAAARVWTLNETDGCTQTGCQNESRVKQSGSK